MFVGDRMTASTSLAGAATVIVSTPLSVVNLPQDGCNFS